MRPVPIQPSLSLLRVVLVIPFPVRCFEGAPLALRGSPGSCGSPQGYRERLRIAQTFALLYCFACRITTVGEFPAPPGGAGGGRYFSMLAVEAQTTRRGSRCMEGALTFGSRIIRSSSRLLCTPI